MFKEILNIFFPHLCVCCGLPLNVHEELLCDYCRYDLPFTNYERVADNPIEQRFWGRVYLKRATSLLFFNKSGKVQSMMHQLKYGGCQDIGVMMGRIAALRCKEFFSDIDYIIPVPLHKKKMKIRGYNQSYKIAEGISQISGNTIAEDLKRNVNSSTQTHKGKYDRYLNTIGNFCFEKSPKYEDKTILLVDDVLTTGATIEACASAINAVQKNVNICVFTLCVAVI